MGTDPHHVRAKYGAICFNAKEILERVGQKPPDETVHVWPMGYPKE